MKSFKNIPNKYKTFNRCLEAIKYDESKNITNLSIVNSTTKKRVFLLNPKK